ncbi:hypothetical protein CSKR_101178 [Clonorchis sinensis]|uniref:Uncharacterized protein n=1 Tax=Clonorchis sinensis TaxID=79923 RepID=A0A3R7G1G8_CLOSI|nr:hypothetical protein CSKR_101178 [Clonorchis sinensis]
MHMLTVPKCNPSFAEIQCTGSPVLLNMKLTGAPYFSCACIDSEKILGICSPFGRFQMHWKLGIKLDYVRSATLTSAIVSEECPHRSVSLITFPFELLTVTILRRSTSTHREQCRGWYPQFAPKGARHRLLLSRLLLNFQFDLIIEETFAVSNATDRKHISWENFEDLEYADYVVPFSDSIQVHCIASDGSTEDEVNPVTFFFNVVACEADVMGLRPTNDRQRKWMPTLGVLRTNTPEQTVVIGKVGVLFSPGSSLSEPVLNTMLRAAARYYATLTGKPVSTEEDESQTTVGHCPEGQSSLENYGFQITKRRPTD